MDPLQQPPQQDFAPAPASPPQVGSAPAPEQGEMSQEMMKANLEALMNKIQEKYQSIKGQRSTTDQTIQEQKGIALKEIFDLFQSMGINPNSAEEIRAFLDSIRESDPELSARIEKAIQDLLADEIDPTAITQPTGEISPENMNIPNDQTIQQNL